MKKFLLLAAACVALVACNNNEGNEPTTPNRQVTICATVDIPVGAQAPGRTVAPIDLTAATVNFTWEAGDQVTIKKGSESQVLTIVANSISADGKTANFTGTALSDMSSYTVEYSLFTMQSSVNNITYIENSYKPMITGEGAEDVITLNTVKPIIELQLKKEEATDADITLTKIEYMGMGGKSCLNISNGVVIGATAKTIYFPVAAASQYFSMGSFSVPSFTFYDANGIVMTKGASIAINDNTVTVMPELGLYQQVTSVSFKDPTPLHMDKGTSKKMEVNISPANAKYKDLTWSSDNPEKFTVDQEGNVTALDHSDAGGQAKITCTANHGITSTTSAMRNVLN